MGSISQAVAKDKEQLKDEICKELQVDIDEKIALHTEESKDKMDELQQNILKLESTIKLLKMKAGMAESKKTIALTEKTEDEDPEIKGEEMPLTANLLSNVNGADDKSNAIGGIKAEEIFAVLTENRNEIDMISKAGDKLKRQMKAAFDKVKGEIKSLQEGVDADQDI